MTKPKKLIFSLDFSYVNLRLGWNSLRSFRIFFKFSSESVQLKFHSLFLRTQFQYSSCKCKYKAAQI